MTLYGLLVAIDSYPPPAPPLRGCRNDIAALADYLRARTDVELALRVLHDEAATRQAVIVAFRDHLGQARAGDVALFAYAGHGSEEPVPPELADLEPTGRLQTLMFHDCNRRVNGRLVRALADKELAVLLAEVGAGGAHVAVVLDSCHSGGATRAVDAIARGWSPLQHRDLGEPELTEPRPLTEFVPGALEQWRAPSSLHVALSACRSSETAEEHDIGGAVRGAFSVALLDALAALGARTTYRSLLDTLRSRVERTTSSQRPELYPIDRGGPGDALFLDGTVTPVPPTFSVTRATDGWVVDAGLAHGLRPPEGEEAFVLACTAPNGTPAGTVRVTDVSVGRSSVEPIGWDPDDLAYSASIAEVPLPAAEVIVDEDTDLGHSASIAPAIEAAVASAGPAGGPSPFVRIVSPSAGSAAALRLRVVAPSPGVAQITRLDGSAISTPIAVAAGGARLVVSRLEHIARWEQVRALGEHASPLADSIRLDVYDAAEGEDRRPADRQPRVSEGGHRLGYRVGSSGTLLPPRVFIDVTNQSADDLHVAVLDLTDRFRCHVLLPTVALRAAHTVALWDRRPIPVELPPGRAVEPGASVQDWMKVIVSDVDFDATSAELPPLDDAPTRSGDRKPPRTTIERLFARAIRRDIGPAGPTPVPARWAASTITIETTVP